MSKFKHAALALAAASLMAVQAHAIEVQAQSPHAVPVATFSQADINTMFEQAGQPMQLAALSGQEMKDTEGAWWFAASLVGGGFGSASYIWSTPNWTWGGVGRSFGAGATGGLWGVTPVHWGIRAAGGAFGAASWYRW